MLLVNRIPLARSTPIGSNQFPAIFLLSPKGFKPKLLISPFNARLTLDDNWAMVKAHHRSMDGKSIWPQLMPVTIEKTPINVFLNKITIIDTSSSKSRTIKFMIHQLRAVYEVRQVSRPIIEHLSPPRLFKIPHKFIKVPPHIQRIEKGVKWEFIHPQNSIFSA